MKFKLEEINPNELIDYNKPQLFIDPTDNEIVISTGNILDDNKYFECVTLTGTKHRPMGIIDVLNKNFFKKYNGKITLSND